MPHLGDGRVNLVAGKLTALAGLGALHHLDLEHVGVDQIFRRHAEAARRHLLDGRTHGVAVGKRLEALRLLAALAGVRLAADAVHGDGDRGMRLAADRTERHGARREPLHDFLGGLHFVERDRRAADFLRRLDAEQAAQRHELLALIVDRLGELAEFLRQVAAHGVLQRGDGIRAPDMRFAALTEGIFAADFERDGAAPEYR